jgi:hypothetical protein
MATTSVLIRARSMDEQFDNPVFFETTATVAQASVGGLPAYLQLDNFLAANPALAGMHYFRIEITPTIPAPIWAFMAITNDDSEQATTVTPE